MQFEDIFEKNENAIAIFQLDELGYDRRFMGMKELEMCNKEVDASLYKMVYSYKDNLLDGNDIEIAEGIYFRFNENKPEDYRTYSLSISDIIAIKRYGVTRYYYVDSFGFADVTEYFFDGQHKERLGKTEKA